LLAGEPIPFPPGTPGTYWLRRFVGVAVDAPEKMN
jgi:hypothetical protein